MRIGSNPEKSNIKIQIDTYHRVVIPVYIPNLEEDYFKDGLRILKLCLASLKHTVHSKTRVSLIDNGCCEEVQLYLEKEYKELAIIDQLHKSKINLGKVNALYASIKSNLEPLITIADADVMFLTNWQSEVENIFETFPEAGMVSPVPSVGSLKGTYLKSSIGFAYRNGRPKKSKVKNLEGINNFQKSIGKKGDYTAETAFYHTISRKNKKAVIGCGHFMATIRATVFENSPNHPSIHKIVGGSEKMYIDKPNDIGGYLKLSTEDNYGYHLGNVYENWMDKALQEVLANKMERIPSKTDFSIAKPSSFNHTLGYIIQKMFIR